MGRSRKQQLLAGTWQLRLEALSLNEAEADKPAAFGAAAPYSLGPFVGFLAIFELNHGHASGARLKPLIDDHPHARIADVNRDANCGGRVEETHVGIDPDAARRALPFVLNNDRDGVA